MIMGRNLFARKLSLSYHRTSSTHGHLSTPTVLSLDPAITAVVPAVCVVSILTFNFYRFPLFTHLQMLRVYVDVLFSHQSCIDKRTT